MATWSLKQGVAKPLRAQNRLVDPGVAHLLDYLQEKEFISSYGPSREPQKYGGLFTWKDKVVTGGAPTPTERNEVFLHEAIHALQRSPERKIRKPPELPEDKRSFWRQLWEGSPWKETAKLKRERQVAKIRDVRESIPQSQIWSGIPSIYGKHEYVGGDPVRKEDPVSPYEIEAYYHTDPKILRNFFKRLDETAQLFRDYGVPEERITGAIEAIKKRHWWDRTKK